MEEKRKKDPLRQEEGAMDGTGQGKKKKKKKKKDAKSEENELNDISSLKPLKKKKKRDTKSGETELCNTSSLNPNPRKESAQKESTNANNEAEQQEHQPSRKRKKKKKRKKEDAKSGETGEPRVTSSLNPNRTKESTKKDSTSVKIESEQEVAKPLKKKKNFVEGTEDTGARVEESPESPKKQAKKNNDHDASKPSKIKSPKRKKKKRRSIESAVSQKRKSVTKINNSTVGKPHGSLKKTAAATAFENIEKRSTNIRPEVQPSDFILESEKALAWRPVRKTKRTTPPRTGSTTMNPVNDRAFYRLRSGFGCGLPAGIPTGI